MGNASHRITQRPWNDDVWKIKDTLSSTEHANCWKVNKYINKYKQMKQLQKYEHDEGLCLTKFGAIYADIG